MPVMVMPTTLATLQVLFWVFLKGHLAAQRAKVVGLALVLGPCCGRLWRHFHLAYWIHCHLAHFLLSNELLTLPSQQLGQAT